MKPAVTLILALPAIFAAPLFAQESTTDQAPEGTTAFSPDAWMKVLKDHSQRETLHDAVQIIRGDTGKWSEAPQFQLAPPIERKPPKMLLDDWADALQEEDLRLTEADGAWLLLKTKQLDDNDRAWVERIERKGDRFTIVVHQAVWQGRYQKTFTYHKLIGVNLGKLAPGEYEATCTIKPLEFKTFDGAGTRARTFPRDNWPKDEVQAESKPIELQAAFRVAAAP